MLAARAGPRPEEEEEAFGARTARQTVQCWCVGPCAAKTSFTRDQASITPSSRISKRSARAMSPTWRARTEGGSEFAAFCQNAVLSMAQSFLLQRAQRARNARSQGTRRGSEQLALRAAARAAGLELECVQL